MRYGAVCFLVGIIICSLASVSSQEPRSISDEFNLEWEYDFGEVYVSTKPLFANDTLFVRTSTSNSNSQSAGIYALDFEGNMLWTKENPNSISHDMSPVEYVVEGQGECGAWPDMLIVGWSDGSLDALHPQTGVSFWHQETESVTWGITGSILFDADQVVVPTRKGLASYCLSDGDVKFDVEAGLGWRNGVVKYENSYFIGDENGVLWNISVNGTTTSHTLGIGKIRHTPLKINDALLIHGQGQYDSKIALFDPITLEIELISMAGSSPGVPMFFNQTLMTLDSQNVKVFDCTLSCTFIEQYPFTSNGESSMVFDNHVMMPRNTVEGGWGLFTIESSNLTFVELFSTEYDWYGTAGSGYLVQENIEILVIANDNGVLQAFTITKEVMIQPNEVETSFQSQILTLILLVLMATSGIQFLKENYQSSFRYLLVISVILSTFAFGEIAATWSSLINEKDDHNNTDQSIWDDGWPDEWIGTQITIFEFDNQTLVSGGNSGHKTALDLTIEAANNINLPVEVSNTAIGKYIDSFDEKQGEGWIYFIDGKEAMISAEYQSISSDSIVHWKMV